MISECGSNPLYQPLDSKYLLAPHRRDRLLEPHDRSEFSRYYIFSLKKCRLAAMPSFLQTDYVVANLLVHAEHLYRSANAVLAINSPRALIISSGYELLSASSVTVVARLPSCYAPFRSVSAPPLPGRYFLCFCNFGFDICLCPLVPAILRA